MPLGCITLQHYFAALLRSTTLPPYVAVCSVEWLTWAKVLRAQFPSKDHPLSIINLAVANLFLGHHSNGSWDVLSHAIDEFLKDSHVES